MELPTQRELFEIPKDVAYINCAQMSPQLRTARRQGEESVAERSSPWAFDFNKAFQSVENLRGLFAQLIGGDTDGVALVPSSSYGLSVAAKNLKLSEGREILLVENEFPANVFVWKELARAHGAHVRFVPTPSDYNWTNAVLTALERQPAIVAIGNCHWLDGSLIDLDRIAAQTHESGAALVLDVTQSVGAKPLNVKKLKPDFLVSSGHKWLLGPYTCSYLYVSDKYRDGQPLESTWINRAVVDVTKISYNEEFRPGARRFDSSGHCNVLQIPMAIEALKQIIDWKVERIERAVKELTGKIAGRANELGLDFPPLEQRVGHILGLRFKDGFPAGLGEKLIAAKVYVSFRDKVLRLSPYLYNTSADIERFFEVLITCL